MASLKTRDAVYTLTLDKPCIACCERKINCDKHDLFDARAPGSSARTKAMSPSLTLRDRVSNDLFRGERGSRQLDKNLEKLMGMTIVRRETVEVVTIWSPEIAAAAVRDTKVTYQLQINKDFANG